MVCATANPHKTAELARLLADVVTVVPRPAEVGDIEESAETLEGNALLKAAAISEATGLPALADDTGLEVDALGGEPGVRSARYAGEHSRDADNRRLLLARLAERGAAGSARAGQFRTVIALVAPDGETRCFEGRCRGIITETERGEGGFGYDAVFAPDIGDGRTFAEMSPEEKDAVSHRRHAVDALVAWLGGRD